MEVSAQQSSPATGLHDSPRAWVLRRLNSAMHVLSRGYKQKLKYTKQSSGSLHKSPVLHSAVITATDTNSVSLKATYRLAACVFVNNC